MPGCSISEGFVTEDLNHEPKYTDEYYKMDDDELERMSYGKEQSMLADPSGEERWHDNLRTRHGAHLKNCEDPNCVKICNNWREHSELSKHVQ